MGLEGSLFFWKAAKVPKRWSLFPQLPTWPRPLSGLAWTTSTAFFSLSSSKNLPTLGPNTLLSMQHSLLYFKHGHLLMPLSCENLSTSLPLHLGNSGTSQWHELAWNSSQTPPQSPPRPLLSASRTPLAHSSFNLVGSILEKSSPPTCYREEANSDSWWNCFFDLLCVDSVTNHTEWPASENSAPLPIKLECLCSEPCPLVDGRKEEINTSPAWGLPF